MKSSRPAPALFVSLAGCAGLLLAGCQKAGVMPLGQAGEPGAPGGGPPGSTGTGGPGFTLPPPMPPAPQPPGEACAAEVHAAQRAAVDLLFLVDVSTSMAKTVAGGTASKWDLARQALLGFLRDPGSSGLNIGLQFFPVARRCYAGVCVGPLNPPGPTPPCPCPAGLTCMPFDPMTPMACPGNPPSCEVADYRKLAVPFAALPQGEPRLAGAFGAQDPRAAMTSGTPTGPAIAGAVDQLAAQVGASPGHRGALVVVTDGEPTLCDPVAADSIAVPVASARQASPPVSTFAIGVFTAEDLARGAGDVIERLAVAGGTRPLIIDPTTDLTARLQEAFNQIRTLAVPCAFAIPQPRAGAVDYGQVNVHVTGTSRDEDLPYVADATRCDPTRGGWYYDSDPATGGTPTRVQVCEASCKALEGDETAKVDLRFGCKTLIVN
jgi:hypothetical protein